jgi:hypothetical protein
MHAGCVWYADTGRTGRTRRPSRCLTCGPPWNWRGRSPASCMNVTYPLCTSLQLAGLLGDRPAGSQSTRTLSHRGGSWTSATTSGLFSGSRGTSWCRQWRPIAGGSGNVHVVPQFQVSSCDEAALWSGQCTSDDICSYATTAPVPGPAALFNKPCRPWEHAVHVGVATPGNRRCMFMFMFTLATAGCITHVAAPQSRSSGHSS